MFSRWYTVAVILFWLATMGWLVKEKILPPMLVGDPPSYRTILAAEQGLTKPIAWEVHLNGRHLGGAATVTERLPDGINRLRCRVSLKELPLSELTPAWISAFVNAIDAQRSRQGAIISVESDTQIDVDPLNRPMGFASITKIGPAGVAESALDMQLNIVMRGKVVGDAMQIQMRSGEFEYKTQFSLPPDALMGDVLSPQTRLPGLRVGQTWTVPVYSPFRPPNSPIEMLHATVERKDPIFWHERIVPALLVVYRGDPGGGLTSNHAARAQMWVDYDGEVIQQEVWLLSSRLKFVRADPDRESAVDYIPNLKTPLRVPPAAMENAMEPGKTAEPPVAP